MCRTVSGVPLSIEYRPSLAQKLSGSISAAQRAHGPHGRKCVFVGIGRIERQPVSPRMAQEVPDSAACGCVRSDISGTPVRRDDAPQSAPSQLGQHAGRPVPVFRSRASARHGKNSWRPRCWAVQFVVEGEQRGLAFRRCGDQAPSLVAIAARVAQIAGAVGCHVIVERYAGLRALPVAACSSSEAVGQLARNRRFPRRSAAWLRKVASRGAGFGASPKAAYERIAMLAHVAASTLRRRREGGIGQLRQLRCSAQCRAVRVVAMRGRSSNSAATGAICCQQVAGPIRCSVTLRHHHASSSQAGTAAFLDGAGKVGGVDASLLPRVILRRCVASAQNSRKTYRGSGLPFPG